MKKFLSFLLIACMLFSFSSCTEPVTTINPPQRMTQSDLATIIAFQSLVDELTTPSNPGEPNPDTPDKKLPYTSETLNMTMHDMHMNMKATSDTNFVNTLNASFSTPDKKNHSISQTIYMSLDDDRSIPIVNEMNYILDGKNLDMTDSLIIMKTDSCVQMFKKDSNNELPFTYQGAKLIEFKSTGMYTYNATLEINGKTYDIVLTESPINTTINGNLLYE